MESRGAFRSPALLLALLTLLIDLGCARGLRSAEAPTAPEAAVPSASLSGGGLAAVQRHIAEREYRASRNGHGLQAPNRRHNLRTYFGASGIRVHDRTAAGSPELLAIEPGFTAARFASSQPYRDAAALGRLTDSLRRAGVAEGDLALATVTELASPTMPSRRRVAPRPRS